MSLKLRLKFDHSPKIFRISLTILDVGIDIPVLFCQQFLSFYRKTHVMNKTIQKIIIIISELNGRRMAQILIARPRLNQCRILFSFVEFIF